MSLPDLTDLERFAFFFDFDGTLAEIAERPEDVEVTEAARATIEALRSATHGAVAIITGRDIASIDHFLDPVHLPVAGVHGLTRRDANGQLHAPEIDTAALASIETALEPLVNGKSGLILERKHGAVALHYRKRPELEGECLTAMEDAARRASNITIRRGKMVIEATGHSSNKGAAIGSFLGEVPFSGRVPVFAGDDLTDEDGFAFVNAQKGISIKVGCGDTEARYRVEDREGLIDWLNGIIDHAGKTKS
ncbi:MAG: trehalose-phosphatase [Rhodomicrobiaceae bacterium]